MLLLALQFLLLPSLFSHSVSAFSQALIREVDSNRFLTNFRNGSSRQRIAYHSMTLLKDYVYIEGGQISSIIDGKQTDNSVALPANRTFSFPVNKAWEPETLEFADISYTSDMRPMNYVGLWADETRNALYRWAGGLLASDRDYTSKFFKMEPDNNGGGKWVEESPANTDTFRRLKASEKGAYTFCGDVGVYIGGIANSFTGYYGSTEYPARGVRMYNATNMMWDDDIETNTNDFNDDSVHGEAVCLPGFRKQPPIIVLGGRRSGDGVYLDMKTVRIYDPVSQSWYLQNTISDNGDFPGARQGACAVSVQGKNGTLEIFMAGGVLRDPPLKVYDDIWVLSLPAFKWFRISGLMPEARQMHRCVVAGNRQMISVGGLKKYGMDGYKDADPWSRGIGIFDLVELKWKTSFDPNLGEYDSPEVVREWYGNGNAESVRYTEGLESIFQNITNGTSTPRNEDTKSSTNIAGIAAGASIGGVAAIALAAGAFWYLRRRHRAQQETEQQQEVVYLPKTSNKDDPVGSPELDSTVVLELQSQHRSELPGSTTFVEMDATPRPS